MEAPKSSTIYLPGGETGILLLHGFTSTPYELEPLAHHLHQYGYTVYAPLLAGHGTTPEEMEATNYTDWVGSAIAGYQFLRERCQRVYLGGLSMGGAIALYLAARHQAEGVISMCAPIFVTNKHAGKAWLLRHFVRFQAKRLIRPPHVQRYLIGYDRTPVRSAAQLMTFIKKLRRSLRDVAIPALILQAERDETVQPHSATYIFDHIGSEQKDIKHYPQSGHILPVDVEKELVFQEILSFLRATS